MMMMVMITVCTDMRTDRHTTVKTIYPPVSLRSLGRYNYYKTVCAYWMLLTYTHYSRNFSAGAVGDDGDVIFVVAPTVAFRMTS